MTTLPNRRVALTLLAHPDDAEILCAGTLIRLAEAGWEIHIATVAAGDCGTTIHTREKIASIRREEGIAAAAKIGATYRCLEEPDVQVVLPERPGLLLCVSHRCGSANTRRIILPPPRRGS